MIIGGYQKSSLIDYPGKISAIIFTQGCNFRCPYCYNPELVDRKRFTEPIPEEEIISFLNRRQDKLDGVVFTGGEPVIQSDLLEFMQRIRKKGFLIKLDTNGSRPEVISEIISKGLVDFLSMDVKGPWEKYSSLVNKKVDTAKIQKTMDIVMDSAVDYEIRTTVVKGYISKEDLFKIGKAIEGAKCWVLQQFRPNHVLDPNCCQKSPYTIEELEDMKNDLIKFVDNCLVR